MEQTILMIGNDLPYMNTDRIILQQAGNHVYTSDRKQDIDELMEEVKPDIIFINWKNHTKDSSELYNY
jgi:two-component SAPR family response regulator